MLRLFPDRDAIEADFLDWRSPKDIAQDYNLSSFYPIYRHARATGLASTAEKTKSPVLWNAISKESMAIQPKNSTRSPAPSASTPTSTTTAAGSSLPEPTTFSAVASKTSNRLLPKPRCRLLLSPDCPAVVKAESGRERTCENQSSLVLVSIRGEGIQTMSARKCLRVEIELTR